MPDELPELSLITVNAMPAVGRSAQVAAVHPAKTTAVRSSAPFEECAHWSVLALSSQCSNCDARSARHHCTVQSCMQAEATSKAVGLQTHCRSDAEKLQMISELQKPTDNRKRVGPAAAQKLLRVLTATDPELPVQG